MNPYRCLLSLYALLAASTLFSNGALAQDLGARLARAFPAPSWQQNGPEFVCVADACGKGSLVELRSGEGDLEESFRSGKLDDNWFRQFAAYLFGQDQDDITVIEANSYRGTEIPNAMAFYRCTCSKEIKHIALRITVSGKSYLTLISMARSPDSALQNLRKIEMAMTGT